MQCHMFTPCIIMLTPIFVTSSERLRNERSQCQRVSHKHKMARSELSASEERLVEGNWSSVCEVYDTCTADTLEKLLKKNYQAHVTTLASSSDADSSRHYSVTIK